MCRDSFKGLYRDISVCIGLYRDIARKGVM